jgi:hypothetical protein
MSITSRHVCLSAAVVAALLSTTIIAARAQAQAPAATSAVSIGAQDIGGVVKSSAGPEAGVWVIAETASLPTPFRKIVVTSDDGRFVVPDLPKGAYPVWLRGDGLMDSAPADAAGGG